MSSTAKKLLQKVNTEMVLSTKTAHGSQGSQGSRRQQSIICDVPASRFENRLIVAKGLMLTHGLSSEWKLTVNQAKLSYGYCCEVNKIISLSKYLVQFANDDNFNNVVLHEIAHGLVGNNETHGPAWVTKALLIGCDGKRSADIKEVDIEVDKTAFELKCSCGHVSMIRYKPYSSYPNCKICKSVITQKRV